MYCPSCGKTLPEKAAFCPSCGAPVPVPVKEKKRKRNPGLIVLIALLTAVAIGAAGFLVFISGDFTTRMKNKVLSPYNGVTFHDPSDKEAVLAAYRDLLDEAVVCCKTDNMDYIAVLYRDYENHIPQISNEVPAFYYYMQNQFPETNYSVICSDGTYAYISALNWQIDGTYPDESVQFQTLNHILSKDTDGTWKFDASQEAVDAITAFGKEMVPSGYLDAAQQMRNTAIFNAYRDYTWVTMQVIPGAASGTCYFIWQDAQGDIHCLINVKNGTDKTQEIDSVTVAAEDSALGQVFTYCAQRFRGTKVPAGTAKNLEVVIPLKETVTKQDPWYTLTAHVNVTFK